MTAAVSLPAVMAVAVRLLPAAGESSASIPRMTDPLGRSWSQPDRSEIRVGIETAHMSQRTLDRLLEYSASIPSGVYPGKMWRARYRDGWLLRWYGPDCGGRCGVFTRAVIVLGGVA